jgi:allantoate deiminase
MTALVAEAISKNQNACPRLTSGAGHDAVALSATARVAMIFVRCQDGVSHHPDEYSSVEDISAAIRVLTEFLREFRPE